MDLDKSGGNTTLQIWKRQSLWQTGVESLMKSWSMTKIIRVTVFKCLIQITTYLFEIHPLFYNLLDKLVN